MTTNKKLIAIHDVDQHLAGELVWWELSGVMEFKPLSQAWVEAGLNPSLLPSLCEPKTALRYAANAVAGSRKNGQNVIARPLKGDGDKAYALVLEAPQGKKYRSAHMLTAYLTPRGDITFEVPETVNQDKFGEWLNGMRTRMTEEFKLYLRSLSHHEASEWLKGLVRHLDAITMRDRGGVYFIPRAERAEWDEMKKVIRSHSRHVVHSIPCVHTEEVVTSVTHGVIAEIRQEAETIARQLEEGKLAARALESRQAKLAELRDKVRRYSAALGISMNDATDILDDIDASVAQEMLKAGKRRRQRR